jgi:hypothetical protein
MDLSSKTNPAPDRFRMELAKDFLAQAKPFTKALMLRATQLRDQGYKDLKEPEQKPDYLGNDTKFEDIVASSAIATSVGLAQLAAKRIGLEPNFLPGSEIPKEAPTVVAFSLCILHVINEFLAGDGVTINLKLALIDTARMHYLFYGNQEASERAFEGLKLFKEIQSNDSKDICAWREGMSKLVSIYVLQWISENLDLKKLDCISLFGKCLKLLLNVGLHGIAQIRDSQPSV